LSPTDDPQLTRLPWEVPAPEGLLRVLRERLPSQLQGPHSVGVFPGGLVLRFRDPQGALHALDLREDSPATDAWLRLQGLAFAVRQDETTQGPSPADHELCEALARVAPRLLPWVLRPSRRPDPRLPAALVTEEDLVRAHLSGERALHALLPPSGGFELTLYLANACRQACEFCEVPALRERPSHRMRAFGVRVLQGAGLDAVSTGALERLLARCEALGHVSLLITGSDWALHPRRDALLHTLSRCPLPVRFLGPSTTLDAAALDALGGIPALRAVGLTLVSPTPSLHDRVTRAPGSGESALAALEALRARGLPAQVQAVLTVRGVDALPGLLPWLAARSLPTTLLAFLPDGLAGGARARPLHPSYAHLQGVLHTHLLDAARVLEELSGVPLCVVPEALRDRVVGQPWTPPREPLVFPPGCSRCALRGRCTGVPASALHRAGGLSVVP
jgi:hypothetical protein